VNTGGSREPARKRSVAVLAWCWTSRKEKTAGSGVRPRVKVRSRIPVRKRPSEETISREAMACPAPRKARIRKSMAPRISTRPALWYGSFSSGVMGLPTQFFSVAI
jgi:hypothetical protein